MRRSREMTEHALRCRAHDIATCPRFSAIVEDLVSGERAAFPRVESWHDVERGVPGR